MRHGERTSWAVVGALVVAAAAQQSLGCGPAGEPEPQGDPRLEAVLQVIGPDVVEPALDRFVDDAEALRDATAAWAAALDGGGAADDERSTAQQAFLDAMATWQELEVMQVGPAASSLADAAGLDLRDAIYAWPSTNACRVDQETVLAPWEDPEWVHDAPVNVIGLDALEVTLFSAPDENACPDHTEPNASGAWTALGDDGVRAARSAYAAVLAAHVVEVATSLRAAWTEGDFGARLASGEAHGSQREALNAVYNALFYLETRTKDRKVGPPLGLVGCATDVCLDLVETPLAGGSQHWVAANLVGARALLTGADGHGLDDLLHELGHGDVADTLLAALDAAVEAADELAHPLDEAVEADPEGLRALYDAVKSVTDVVKGDLATVLLLEIPQEAAGDND